MRSLIPLGQRIFHRSGGYFSEVNLQNYLTLQKIANFCIENLICALIRFLDGFQTELNRFARLYLE